MHPFLSNHDPAQIAAVFAIVAVHCNAANEVVIETDGDATARSVPEPVLILVITAHIWACRFQQRPWQSSSYACLG
jgi:hypothetical protein